MLHEYQKLCNDEADKKMYGRTTKNKQLRRELHLPLILDDVDDEH